MTTSTRPLSAYLFLAAGLLLATSSPILVRYADEGPGLAVATWRTVFAVLFLLPFAPRVRSELRRLERRDLLLIGAAGLLLALHFIFFIESLYHTSVANATVLVTTAAIFSPILGFLLLKERLTLMKVLAILVAFTGTALITWGSRGDASFPRAGLGNLLALSGAFVFTLYLIIGRKIRQRTSWLAYVFPLFSVVAVGVVLISIGRGVPLFGYSPTFYGLCALMGLLPQIIGHGSFNYAVRYFPVAWIGVAGLVEPVLAPVMAYFLFGEAPGLLAFGGMVVVLAAIVFVFLAPGDA